MGMRFYQGKIGNNNRALDSIHILICYAFLKCIANAIMLLLG